MSPVEVFTVPAKKLVRKAGSVLAGRSDVMTEDQAMDILSKWRALHAYPINTLQAYLRGVLKRNKFAGAIVAQRLKRTPSIVEKLKRFENMSLDRMQDIGGLRVIVDNIADIYRLHQLMLNSTRFKHQLDLPPHDYIKSPKNDGYRSLHQVIRYQNESHEELNGLRLEIQIRTKLQHSWATAVETLGMIQKSSLKAGQGDDETKEFLKTVSALFALKENQPLPPAFETATRDELIGSLLALDKRKNFLAQFEGVAVSAHHIDTVTKDYTGYHVMQLFISEKSVRLTAFTEAQDAESFYKTKEMETKDDPNIAIVLMSAGALKEIKKAYPNYFLDTTAFLKNIKQIVS